MNKIRVASIVVQICQWLLVGGAIFAILFFTFLDQDEMITLDLPSASAVDDKLTEQINKMLSEDFDANVFISDVDVEIPLDNTIRAAIITSALLVFGYLFLIIRSISQIVDDVRKEKAFSYVNSIRFKNLAWLFILAPIFESLLVFGFKLAMNFSDNFPKQLISEASMDFNFNLLVMGLLLYAVAVAFEQGMKMKEEQDLTI